ncbi:MAG: TrkH family potassium uptake protein [Methanomassiliicoccaceae archaeon]|nr:TrkH family potassium uptake protein [Methanomassiliicoccaceae archaeon]
MPSSLKARIKNRAIWESSTIKVLGVIEMILGISLLAPAVIALFYGEDPWIFVYPVPFLLILGTLQYVLFKNVEIVKPASGLMMMFAAWWVAFFVSSIPFFLHGASFVDSLFEGVSGFTTTGMSAIEDSSLPYSMLFWRSITQWAGGIAVVMIFLFLIPMMGIGGKAFVNNELTGSETYKFSMRIKSAARNFVSIYVLLSVAEAVLLMICGVGSFESITTMLSTISTGGFVAGGDGVAGYSFAAQVVVLAFMFLGGTNFYLHYRALNKREFSAYRKSQEFIWTVIWFLLATVAITAILLISADDLFAVDIGNTIWHTLFTVVSMGTTTGYVITDTIVWPLAAVMIMWMVMLFGSMSGSTSGGVKIYRFLILRSYVKNGIYKMFHPYSVRDVRVDSRSVSSDAVVSAVVVITMFLVALIISTIFLLVSETGMSISESIGLSISAISNVGIDMGGTAIHGLSSASKVFLSFMMWVGRLEVVIALLLFTKTFWRDLISDTNTGVRQTKKRRI